MKLCAARGEAKSDGGEGSVVVSTPEYTAFLQWALPRLGLRWPGYRKVRGQVCKRLRRRLEALGLTTLTAYREYLDKNADEWQRLDGFCRITISRFYRDRGVFDHLRSVVLPQLCRDLEESGEHRLRCLSIGCCGGEEPYTLALVWRFDLADRFPCIEPEIRATDGDPASLEDLPEEWRSAAFQMQDKLFCLRQEFRKLVYFQRQDMRDELPAGPFHLVLCRNLAFSYFDEAGQRQAIEHLAARMPRGSILVLGKHERLPANTWPFEALSPHQAIYQRQ